MKGQVKLSQKKRDYAVSVMEKYLGEALRQSLGTRKMEHQDLKELVVYWVASVIQEYELSKLSSQQLITMSPQQIADYFFAGGTQWDRGLKSYSHMAKTSLSRLIEKKLQEKKVLKILDIGCGQGVFLKELQQRFGEAVDCYAVSNVRQSGTETVHFRLVLAEVLPEEWTDQFDLVTCFESSMYFWDQILAFNEALRVLRSDGSLFYGTNNLKTHTNDVILEEKLGLKDFIYTCPETSVRAGQRYSGCWGKYVSKFMPFFDYLKALVDRNGRFRYAGKQFKMKRVAVTAWCPETIQVSGVTRRSRK